MGSENYNFADLQYYLCLRRWIKKAKNMLTWYKDGPFYKSGFQFVLESAEPFLYFKAKYIDEKYVQLCAY